MSQQYTEEEFHRRAIELGKGILRACEHEESAKAVMAGCIAAIASILAGVGPAEREELCEFILENLPGKIDWAMAKHGQAAPTGTLQ